jgi:hypothetical protein
MGDGSGREKACVLSPYPGLRVGALIASLGWLNALVVAPCHADGAPHAKYRGQRMASLVAVDQHRR